MVRDFLGPNYTFVSTSPSVCTQVATPSNRPAGVAANATTLDCAVDTTGGYGYPGYGYPGAAGFTLDATVNAGATFGTDANANMACIQPAPTSASAPCSTVSLSVGTAPTPTPAPSLQNAITAVNGSPPSPSSTNATLPAGSTVSFQLTTNVPQPAGYPGIPVYPPGYGATVTDFLSPNFTANLSDVSGASCTIVATPANRPAGVAADATTIQCTPSFPTTGSGAGVARIGIIAHLNPNAVSGADPMANVACLGSSSPYGSPYGSAGGYSNCATVQASITGAGAVATGSLTLQQAMAQVPSSGQTGTSCASGAGGACTVAGQVSGQGIVAASMRWTLTATVPAGVAAGTLPFAVFSTTVGQEGFACAPVGAGVTTVSCTGVTAGNALQGSTVTVVFGPGVSAVGNVTSAIGGTAGAVPPLLPPLPPAPVPPAPPLPAAPPALLPPPPVVPGLARAPVGAYPEVPVIPEADSLPLLGGGLAGLAALAWLRRRRARGA
jgi:hypothetical protein